MMQINGVRYSNNAPPPGLLKYGMVLMEFDLFTLLPLAAAVFIFWKLRSVLGTRNGNERPPMDPYVKDNRDNGDNVVTLPGTTRQREEGGVSPTEAMIEEIAGKNKSLKQGLTAILSLEPDFDPEQFIGGAKMAYEMIVTGFADGDKKSLKRLLSKDVYDSFAKVIDERTKRGEVVKTTFIGIERAEYSNAELIKKDAHVTVSFVSQMISATLDKDENLIDGDLNEIAEITDVWTFARPLKSGDPNWKLVATDA